MEQRTKNAIIGGIALAATIFGGVAINQLVISTKKPVPQYTKVVGIPDPSFGVRESYTSFTHFVSNIHPSATDANNPQGTASRPRRSVPSGLQPGAVVSIEGGGAPYSWGGSGYIEINGQGTATRPILIVGTGRTPPRFSQKVSVWGGGTYESRYLVFQNLDLYKWEVIGPAHHIALRMSEVRNGGAIGIGGRAGYPVSDVVVWKNLIHDNGNWLAETDEDIHGVTIGGHSSGIWVVDNELYHNSGNGVQVNAGSLATQPTTNHIYIGGNKGHHNKQCFAAVKQAVDVVISQNDIFGQRPIGVSPSDWGAGLGYQYGPERVWMIFNKIHDCSFGIQTNSTSGLGFGTESFFVGNVIWNCRHDPSYSYNPNTAWSNGGMSLVGTPKKYIVNNTIYGCDAGINIPGSVELEVVGNVVAEVAEPRANHFYLEDVANNRRRVIEGNLFSQMGGAARFRLGNQPTTLVSLSRNVEGSPVFDSIENARFETSPSSPAVNLAGPLHPVYSRFESLYGLSIAVDILGRPRLVGGGVDAGAYEVQE